jgi:hypothetical protein
MFANRALILIGSLLLASCAALNVVHDPQSGLITRSQVPKLLQSVRCELVTFYTVNRWRNTQFHLTKDFATAVKNYSYFPLAEDELSAVFLDLKVIDNIGIPSGAAATTVNQTILSNGGVDKRTWHLGPSIADTNTYELNWPFVVAQNAALDLSHHEGGREKSASANDFFPCYHNLPARPAEPSLEGLARHQFPEMENFARIYVDGTETLAGWMLNSSAELGTAYFEKNQNVTEIMYPAQMLYTFTVQFGFGVDASLSLITAKWNPVGLDIAGSTQQTSMLTLYINGKDSINAYAAKVGLAGAVPQSGRSLAVTTPCGPPECSGARPRYPIAIPIPQQQQ